MPLEMPLGFKHHIFYYDLSSLQLLIVVQLFHASDKISIEKTAQR